jgi:hypothetical protein
MEVVSHSLLVKHRHYAHRQVKTCNGLFSSAERAVLNLQRPELLSYCPNRPMITPMMIPPSAPIPMIGA